MPDVDAIIQHGPLPDAVGIVTEPNMIVENLVITPTREEKVHKGVNRAAMALEYVDPRLVFQYQAVISSVAGLCDQHPGTAVTDLENYPAAIHGFDPTQGTMVYKDPSRQMDTEDPAKINFTVEQFPFVEEEEVP